MRYVIWNEFRYTGFLNIRSEAQNFRMYREFGSNYVDTWLYSVHIWIRCHGSPECLKRIFMNIYDNIGDFFFLVTLALFPFCIFWEEGVKMGKKKKKGFIIFLKKCTTTNVPDVSMPYDTLAGALNRLTSISLMQLERAL